MGHPSKGASALTRQVFARLTDAQHAAYLQAGGSDWLRLQADALLAAPETPRAHRPFPIHTARKAGRPLRFGRALTERREVRLTPDQDAALNRLGGQDFLRGILQLVLAREAAERCRIPVEIFPTFTVTDAKTGDPVPHTVVIREF